MRILRFTEMEFPFLPHLPRPAGIYSRSIDISSATAMDGLARISHQGS